jgi:hypothetical protein
MWNAALEVCTSDDGRPGAHVSRESAECTQHHQSKALLVCFSYENNWDPNATFYQEIVEMDIAYAWKNLLNMGWHENEITVISDFELFLRDPDTRGKTEQLLAPGNAQDKSGLRKYMQWLVKGARTGDQLFFHFTGHGLQMEDTGSDELDGMDECLVAADNLDYYCDDEIYKDLIAPLPEGVTFNAVVDCCHSEGMFDLPYNFDPEEGTWCWDWAAPAFGNWWGKFWARPKAQVIMLAAAKNDEEAEEAAYAGALSAGIWQHYRQTGLAWDSLPAFIQGVIAKTKSGANTGLHTPNIAASHQINSNGEDFMMYNPYKIAKSTPAVCKDMAYCPHKGNTYEDRGTC